MCNNLKQNVMFTPNDIHTMFKISEGLTDVQDDIAKYHAVTDIFAEALESCKENEVAISNEILFWVISVLRDYSTKVISEISEACDDYSALFSEKRDLSLGGDFA